MSQYILKASHTIFLPLETNIFFQILIYFSYSHCIWCYCVGQKWFVLYLNSQEGLWFLLVRLPVSLLQTTCKCSLASCVWMYADFPSLFQSLAFFEFHLWAQTETERYSDLFNPTSLAVSFYSQHYHRNYRQNPICQT